MAETEKTEIPFIEEGNKGFDVYTRNSDNTFNAGIHISGMMSLSATITAETVNIAADDDPTYMTREKPITVDGTVTFAKMTVSDYKALYANITDGNEAIVFGRRGMTKQVGYAFNNTRVFKDGTTADQRISFLNAVFSLPPIETQTVQEDDDTVRPFSVPFKAYIHNYTRKDGKSDRAAITIVNSKDNADIWDQVKDKLYIPDMDVSDLI